MVLVVMVLLVASAGLVAVALIAGVPTLSKERLVKLMVPLAGTPTSVPESVPSPLAFESVIVLPLLVTVLPEASTTVSETVKAAPAITDAGGACVRTRWSAAAKVIEKLPLVAVVSAGVD